MFREALNLSIVDAVASIEEIKFLGSYRVVLFSYEEVEINKVPLFNYNKVRLETSLDFFQIR